MSAIPTVLRSIGAEGAVPFAERLVVHNVFDDERMWVPYGAGAQIRPLMFDLANGDYVSVLRTNAGCGIGRHLHPTPVHGWTIQGCWRYLEYDFVLRSGDYIYEPPGSVHTYSCEQDDTLAFFFQKGPVIYLDEDDQVTSVEDNRSMLAMCRDHYATVGLDPALLDALVR